MRIVMTGATSGIGLEAARLLINAADTQLLIGARQPLRAPAILQDRAQLRPLDLASLASVREFAARIGREGPLDVLLLNAGIQNVSDARSSDGFELSFAVNHLAHFLLVQLLVPHMAPSGRIILTASGTHDPDEKSGLPPPRHIDAGKLARPETDSDLDKAKFTRGRRAYSTSKLANVMTARELARRLDQRSDLMIASFDPGFTPGTGLARDYPGPANWIFRNLLRFFVKRTDRVSTPSNSGRLLAELATAPEHGHRRGHYMAVRGDAVIEVPPSKLAQDGERATALWDDSARLVGL